MNDFAVVSGLSLMLLLPTATQCQAQSPPVQDPRQIVVGVRWLQDHHRDPSLVVLHVGSSLREYHKGHLPGARFLWTQALVQSAPDRTLDLPSAVQADTVFRNLGLREESRVVLCFTDGNVSPTTRVLFTMEQLGLRGRVSLLDGGLEAWKAEGLPLSQETPMVSPGTLRSTSHQTAVVDAEWIVQHQKDSGVKIVDARTPQFYQGSGGGMPRAGHIPGALNIPFSSVVDSTNKLKDDSTLTAMFTSTGIRTGDTIVSYCHIGQQATVLYLVARHLGHEARLYDGSFEDWSGRDELPVDSGHKGN